MKLMIMLSTLLLTSCYALSNPQGTIQSVKLVDANQKVYKTTCSGMVEMWPDCLSKAKTTCDKGYIELEKIITPAGARRELKFQCK